MIVEYCQFHLFYFSEMPSDYHPKNQVQSCYFLVSRPLALQYLENKVQTLYMVLKILHGMSFSYNSSVCSQNNHTEFMRCHILGLCTNKSVPDKILFFLDQQFKLNIPFKISLSPIALILSIIRRWFLCTKHENCTISFSYSGTLCVFLTQC